MVGIGSCGSGSKIRLRPLHRRQYRHSAPPCAGRTAIEMPAQPATCGRASAADVRYAARGARGRGRGGAGVVRGELHLRHSARVERVGGGQLGQHQRAVGGGLENNRKRRHLRPEPPPQVSALKPGAQKHGGNAR